MWSLASFWCCTVIKYSLQRQVRFWRNLIICKISEIWEWFMFAHQGKITFVCMEVTVYDPFSIPYFIVSPRKIAAEKDHNSHRSESSYCTLGQTSLQERWQILFIFFSKTKYFYVLNKEKKWFKEGNVDFEAWEKKKQRTRTLEIQYLGMTGYNQINLSADVVPWAVALLRTVKSLGINISTFFSNTLKFLFPVFWPHWEDFFLDHSLS